MTNKTIILFDVDGTLTMPRLTIEQNMIDCLQQLQKKYAIGIVGGSDLAKIKEQVGQNVIEMMDFCFSQNGLYSLKKGQFLQSTSFLDKIGNTQYNKFCNFCLSYLSTIEIPVKRGTFIELRNGMINISPIGRSCSQKERDDFEIYDKEHKIRQKFIDTLKIHFADLDMTYSIGGQISFDVFPKGWDKTFCLQYLNEFNDIHFFGDKTFKGGNDHEIFSHENVKGYTVTSPESTIKQVSEQFLK